MDHTPINDEMLVESRRQLDTRFEQLALSLRRVLAERDEARKTVAALRKSRGQAYDELYGDPEARIGGWKERAVAAEAALRLIADLGGKTLLGPEWDEERHHEMGAANAFEQCAEIARAALALAQPE